MLERTRKFQYHMVLAPMLANDYYFDFYGNVDGHVMLDNGVAEGIHLSYEELLQAAYKVGADEVIAPDVYGDMQGTLRSLRMFMAVSIGWEVMAVLQSSTWKEFETILEAAIDLGVASVALPRVMCKTLGEHARLIAAEMVAERTSLPIHALGCTERLMEAHELAKQEIVRSIDSSAPVVLGLQGRDLAAPYTASRRPTDFFTERETEFAVQNMHLFRLWCMP